MEDAAELMELGTSTAAFLEGVTGTFFGVDLLEDFIVSVAKALCKLETLQTQNATLVDVQICCWYAHSSRRASSAAQFETKIDELVVKGKIILNIRLFNDIGIRGLTALIGIIFARWNYEIY